MQTEKSQQLFLTAQKYIPGGVNSPARAFGSVGSQPVFIEKANGATLTDVDGNEFIDYVGSWGPMILGHAHPEVLEAIQQQIPKSTSYGACCELEYLMAKKVCELTGNQKVRFVNSGTEATMSAIRMARGYTKKTKIIKFEGCYHGHADSFLIKAGSGLATMGQPDSAGIGRGITKDTAVAQYNNIDTVKAFVQYSDDIAAIIVEPIAGNMGCVLPEKGFLEELRTICDKNKIVLIFDEVISGFRIGLGGAQAHFNVKADLVCYGKIIGGGLPVGAVAGKAQIMDILAPVGPVYQAGTLSGNPLAMAAGLQTLKLLETLHPYAELENKTQLLTNGVLEIVTSKNLPITINQIGSLFTIFFNNEKVTDFQIANKSDKKAFANFFNALFTQGIYLPPSQFECWFVSAAHTMQQIDKTLSLIEKALE